MKLNISFPANGSQKLIEIEDERKLRIFMDRRMGAEVPGDSVGDEFKGYIFKITGGNDKQGFPMKQGVMHPTRVRLLSLIAATDAREACICDLTEPVGLSQPTVSHHMKQLVEAGLATREQRGRWAYYRVVDGALAAAAQALLPQ